MVPQDVLGTGDPVFLRDLFYEVKFKHGQFYVPKIFVIDKKL